MAAGRISGSACPASIRGWEWWLVWTAALGWRQRYGCTARFGHRSLQVALHVRFAIETLFSLWEALGGEADSFHSNFPAGSGPVGNPERNHGQR
jgi:hypothetical protein